MTTKQIFAEMMKPEQTDAARIAALEARVKELEAALTEVVEDDDVFMPPSWWEKTRALLERTDA